MSVRWSFLPASGLTVRRLSNKPGVFKLDGLVVLRHLNLLLCGRELRHRVKLLLSVAIAKAARCQEGEKRCDSCVSLGCHGAFPSLVPGKNTHARRFFPSLVCGKNTCQSLLEACGLVWPCFDLRFFAPWSAVVAGCSAGYLPGCCAAWRHCWNNLLARALIPRNL